MARKAGYKPKRSKSGAERFNYFGVTSDEFMGAMRTGKYRGKKISRRGSFISQQKWGMNFSLAGRMK